MTRIKPRRRFVWPSPIKIYAATVIAFVLLFLLFPQIDLVMSDWFYDPGTGFVLAETEPFRSIHDELRWLVGLAVIAALGIFALNLWRRTDRLRLRWRGIAFVLISLIVGPGLLANVVLKDQWGRARPSQIVAFGGSATFTPAMVVSDQCDHNCSFVAGDPAIGFWLLAFALLMRRRQALAISAALGAGVALGVMRMAQGGHFLSDVVFCALYVSGIVWLLYLLIVEPDGPGRIAAALARAAGRLRRFVAAERASAAGRYRLAILATGLTVFAFVLLIDVRVAAWARTIDPEWVAIFRMITAFGLSDWYLIGGVLGFAALAIAARRSADPSRGARLRSFSYLPLFLVLSVAGSGLANDLIKALVGRFRPKLYFGDPGVYGFDFFRLGSAYTSFPSGHASTAFALMTVILLIWPRLGIPAVLFAALVGTSRVIVGAHWPSDIVGGGFIGVVVTLYIQRIFANNGVKLSDARAGAARWHRQAGWIRVLYIDRLDAALRALWSTLVVGRGGRVPSHKDSSADEQKG